MKFGNPWIQNGISKTCREAICAGFDFCESTEDPSKQVDDEEFAFVQHLTANALRDADDWTLQKFIGNRVMLKNAWTVSKLNKLLCLFDVESKVNTLRKHMKILSECIVFLLL